MVESSRSALLISGRAFASCLLRASRKTRRRARNACRVAKTRRRRGEGPGRVAKPRRHRGRGPGHVAKTGSRPACARHGGHGPDRLRFSRHPGASASRGVHSRSVRGAWQRNGHGRARSAGGAAPCGDGSWEWNGFWYWVSSWLGGWRLGRRSLRPRRTSCAMRPSRPAPIRAYRTGGVPARLRSSGSGGGAMARTATRHCRTAAASALPARMAPRACRCSPMRTRRPRGASIRSRST